MTADEILTPIRQYAQWRVDAALEDESGHGLDSHLKRAALQHEAETAYERIREAIQARF